MKFNEEGPKGCFGGLIVIIILSALMLGLSLITSSCQQGLRTLFNEPPLCSNCETEDVFMEDLCTWCLQEKYDYDVWCAICGEEFILHTDHYFKGYCNDCAKIDWPEHFCSDCGAYTDTPESFVSNKCARCNQ